MDDDIALRIGLADCMFQIGADAMGLIQCLVAVQLHMQIDENG